MFCWLSHAASNKPRLGFIFMILWCLSSLLNRKCEWLTRVALNWPNGQLKTWCHGLHCVWIQEWRVDTWSNFLTELKCSQLTFSLHAQFTSTLMRNLCTCNSWHLAVILMTIDTDQAAHHYRYWDVLSCCLTVVDCILLLELLDLIW